MAKRYKIKASTTAELTAFLQAIEWVNDSAITIIEENNKTKEALIDDADDDGADEVISVNPESEPCEC